MRNEDLIPTFCNELSNLARQSGILPAKTRRAHLELVKAIETRMESDDYFDSEDADEDLNEDLFNALNEYAAPYFYFGSHPGDGADYGFWLSEGWDEDFETLGAIIGDRYNTSTVTGNLKVSDLADVPSWFRGEVAVVNDHGNVSLYVKTSRTLREVWAIV
jgi:hypothetical protein